VRPQSGHLSTSKGGVNVDLQEQVKELIEKCRDLGYSLQELAKHMVSYGVPTSAQDLDNITRAKSKLHDDAILQEMKDVLEAL